MTIENELQKLIKFCSENRIKQVRMLEPKYIKLRVHYVSDEGEPGEWNTPFNLPRLNNQMRMVHDEDTKLQWHEPIVEKVNESLEANSLS